MSDELIKRLREFHELRAPIPSVPSIATEAADLIEQQAARIAALESQLTAKTELATLYAASLRKVEGDGGGKLSRKQIEQIAGGCMESGRYWLFMVQIDDAIAANEGRHS
jgi:hypothetical protein